MEKKSNDGQKVKKKAAKKKAYKVTKRGVRPVNYSTRFTRMKDATIVKAIQGSNGIISNVAEVLGTDWHTAKGLIERNDKTKQAWEAQEELMLDFAEGKLHEFMQIDPVSLRFYLERKGRMRGFSEKLNIDLTSKGKEIGSAVPNPITVLRLPEHLRPKFDDKNAVTNEQPKPPLPAGAKVQ